jgi:hypothetical protein
MQDSCFLKFMRDSLHGSGKSGWFLFNAKRAVVQLYIMEEQVIFLGDDNDVCFVLDPTCLVGFL